MDHNTIFALQSTPSIVNINKFSQYNSRLMKTGYKRIRPMCNEMNLKKMNRIDNDDNDDSMEDQRINIPNNNIQQQHHEEQDVITHQSVLHRSLAECLKRLCNEIQSNHFLPITMNTSLNTDTINSMNNDYSTCITTPITIPTTNINTTNTSVSMYPTQALDLSITSNITLNECITNDSLNITNTFNKSLSPSPTLSSYYSLNNNNNNLIALTLSSSSSDSSTSLMSSFSNNTMPQQEQQQQQQRNTVSLTNITSHTDSLITSLNYDTSNNIHTNVSSSNDDHSQQQTIHYDSPNIINNAQTLLFPGLTPTIFNLPPCLTCTNTLTPIKSVTDQLINEKDSSDMEQLDLKTTSLWFTESDIHSIPNLVESIKKYHSNDECGFDIILRREEMIRHAKWHRKREESMQYGFMRYSPCDDCTVISCPHNGRQTHYHCMQSNCDKTFEI
uniref:Zinc finger protein castor 1 n=1 Tax=Schistosoma haematobium TaxID=6185 RepID=A0A094ZVX3_SCHHA